MKVLLSERNFNGHRKTYMEYLAKIQEVDFYVLAPENFGVESDHYFKYESIKETRNLKGYLNWILQMKTIAEEYQIEVVHILDGDSIMRWFGFGLSIIKAKKIIITYHHFFPGVMREVSYWLMCHNRKRWCVAHTVSVEQSLKKCGLKNVLHVEYPAFSFESIESRNSVLCKEKYKLPVDVPTIGVVGGLSTYKNIIPFLNVLSKVKEEFHLLICGKESGVNQEQLENAVRTYSDKVTMHIGFLSDDEYEEESTNDFEIFEEKKQRISPKTPNTGKLLIKENFDSIENVSYQRSFKTPKPKIKNYVPIQERINSDLQRKRNFIRKEREIKEFNEQQE